MSTRFRLILVLASITLGVGVGVYVAQHWIQEESAPTTGGGLTSAGGQLAEPSPTANLPMAAEAPPTADSRPVTAIPPAADSSPFAQITPAEPEIAPIEDRTTIDFSSGAPAYRDDGDEQAIMDAALKEMEEALDGMTFGPSDESAP